MADERRSLVQRHVPVVLAAAQAEAQGVAEVLEGHKRPAFCRQMDATEEKVLTVPVALGLIRCKDGLRSHHALVVEKLPAETMRK